jgi:hypothetical protein
VSEPEPTDAPAPAPRPVRSDDGATVALLLSVIGLLGCLPVGATGLLLGYLARDRIRKAEGALSGEGTARAAIVVGWVAVAVSLVALLAVAVAALVIRIRSG